MPQIKIYGVGCSSCGGHQFLFRNDSKVPVKGFKCVNCLITEERGKRIYRTLKRKATSDTVNLFCGFNDGSEEQPHFRRVE